MQLRSLIGDNWTRLVFSGLTLLVTAGAVALEFRTNYLERAIGRYLAWHNASREVSGQIWETVSLSEDVQQRLDDLVHTRSQEASIDEPVGSLDQLIALVHARGKLLVTRDRFLEIYNGLPLYESTLVIEPLELLALVGRLPGWQRTLIEFTEGDLHFYLIDGLNNVLENRTLAAEYVNFLLAARESRSLGLDGVAAFQGLRYPADIFYQAWAALDPQQRAGIPLGTAELIAWRYRLQRLAVNHYALVGDRMEVGFELSGDQGLGTVRVLGKSLSVLALAAALDSLSGNPDIGTGTLGVDSSAGPAGPARPF